MTYNQGFKLGSGVRTFRCKAINAKCSSMKKQFKINYWWA